MGVMSLVGAVLVQVFFDQKTTEVHYAEAAHKKVDIKTTLKVFTMPKFYLSCLIVFCAYGLYTCQSFITPYFTSVLGASVTFAGFLSILKQYALKFVGGPIGGIVADKLGAVSKLQIVVFVLMFGIIMYIANVSGGAELITALTVLTLAFGNALLHVQRHDVGDHRRGRRTKGDIRYRDSCGFNHRLQHARPHFCPRL